MYVTSYYWDYVIFWALLLFYSALSKNYFPMSINIIWRQFCLHGCMACYHRDISAFIYPVFCSLAGRLNILTHMCSFVFLPPSLIRIDLHMWSKGVTNETLFMHLMHINPFFRKCCQCSPARAVYDCIILSWLNITMLLKWLPIWWINFISFKCFKTECPLNKMPFKIK